MHTVLSVGIGCLLATSVFAAIMVLKQDQDKNLTIAKQNNR